jgi:hypothetical protein
MTRHGQQMTFRQPGQMDLRGGRIAAQQQRGPGLDPLLSTGVHLATYSAMLAAASICSILRGEVSETEALDFYATSYRLTYDRFLVLVSVFYESYRGKDYHFYHAQKLTAHERGQLHLHEAFLRIISGIEDLSDAQDAGYSRVRTELMAGDGGSDPLATLLKKKASRPPLTPQNAVRGLYLSMRPRPMRPRLGLHAASQDQPEH